jgi:hypothetical protein
MRFAAKSLAILLFIGLLAGVMGQADQFSAIPAQAQAISPTPSPTGLPSRKKIVPYQFTWYDWWMARWENNEVICRIMVEHTGQPNLAEIRHTCGDQLYSEWLATKPCNLADISTCRGMYMHFVRSFPGKRNVEVVLPQPQIWLSLAGCDPAPTIDRCTQLPSLLFTGEEQLPNEQIIRIQGVMGGQPFSCPGSSCALPLRPTGSQGVTVEFWGDSSFGDSSPHYQAMLRLTPIGDFMAPDNSVSSESQQWTVDVISSQWRDGLLASCADVWQVFPDVGGPPAWLNTPVNLQDMLTTQSYYYLAGNLITSGQVNAGDCPDGGLIAPQVANQCGLEKALPLVVDWQNRFDTQILKVSKDTGVPAQLLKNVFGRESQFWPGMYKTINEAGLGQLTEKGADMLLLWNIPFYQEFCPKVLSAEACAKGFVFLNTDQQNMLRGALVSQVNAACPSCPVGIDLTQAEYSIRVFAESLKASCSQTGRTVTNVSNKAPGLTTSYVDMWKFSLVNYNAGPGCLWSALSASSKAGERLTWDNVSKRLDPVCQAGVEYVSAISGGQRQTATPTAWVFGGTALPAPVFPTAPLYTPTPITPSPTVTQTVTRTPTLNARTATATRAAPTTPGPTATPSRTPTVTQASASTATPPGYNPPATGTLPGYNPPGTATLPGYTGP